jgi:uncharacterized protein YjbI with pentapeptide repeats
MNNPLSRDRLLEILESHQRWILGDTGGERANLDGANLYGANLTRANLTRANLTGANLYGANLTRANLTGADLYGANLYGANLTRANLTGADLYGANLTRANLTGANLYGANLDGANLDGANLTRANLTGANLYGANLDGANLDGANLEKIHFFPIVQNSKWAFTASREELIIGCKKKTWGEWRIWFEGNEEYETKRESADFRVIRESFLYAEKVWPLILEKYPTLGQGPTHDQLRHVPMPW